MVHLSFIAADWRKETARGREKEKEQREAAALRASKTNYSSAGRRHFTIDRHFIVFGFLCLCRVRVFNPSQSAVDIISR
jgi:hypothetical protein